MKEKYMENNQVTVSGRVASGFTFSHEVYGEGFYLADLMVDRLSESSDIIPVMISDRLMDVTRDYMGEYLEVEGQFRSYSRHEQKKNRLLLSVFARDVHLVDQAGESARSNRIYVDGYVCRPAVYRKTPLGREIADILVAVNRPYSRSDYIPCICWGRNARFASGFEVGEHIQAWGRIQSRNYIKKLDTEHIERRIAYEVSINRLETPTPADISIGC